MEALRDFAPYVNDYDNITAALDVLLKRESFQQAVEVGWGDQYLFFL